MGLSCSNCQNEALLKEHTYDIPNSEIIEIYLKNLMTHSIIFGGLEPFDQFDEMYEFIRALREDYGCVDDVVIYSGYTEEEIPILLKKLKGLPNIIVKFGRYNPNLPPKFDEVLGINLISRNQYALKIS